MLPINTSAASAAACLHLSRQAIGQVESSANRTPAASHPLGVDGDKLQSVGEMAKTTTRKFQDFHLINSVLHTEVCPGRLFFPASQYRRTVRPGLIRPAKVFSVKEGGSDGAASRRPQIFCSPSPVTSHTTETVR